MSWKPFERAGLFVSQGVEILFKKNEFPSYHIMATLPEGQGAWRSDAFVLSLPAPEVVAYWVF